MTDPSVDLDVARQQAGLSLLELWLACVGLGAAITPFDLRAWLAGEGGPDAHEHDIVALALNERFADMDLNHPVPYYLPGPLTPDAPPGPPFSER